MPTRRPIPALLATLLLLGCPHPAAQLDVANQRSNDAGALQAPSAAPASTAPSSAPTAAPTPTAAAATTSPSVAPVAAVALEGTLVVPAGIVAVAASSLVSDQTGSLVSDQVGSLVSDQTGSLVSDQTGSLVSDQTGSLVSDRVGSWHLLASSEAALANTAVYLADASSRPLPRLKPAQTDANGHYTFPRVPAGFNFQVVAVVRTPAGKLGRLATLAKAGDTTAAISTASTIVASGVLANDGKPLGHLDDVQFKQAVQEATTKIAPTDLPDFADLAAVAARGRTLARADTTLAPLVAAVKTELVQDRPVLAQVVTAIAQLATATPTPVATALPVVATATPAPVAATPTPTPIPIVLTSPGPGDAAFTAVGLGNGCTNNVEHDIFIQPRYPANEYPLVVTVTAPTAGNVVAQGKVLQGPNPVTLSFPESCGHNWTVAGTSGKVYYGPTQWHVTAGATRTLYAPF